MISKEISSGNFLINLPGESKNQKTKNGWKNGTSILRNGFGCCSNYKKESDAISYQQGGVEPAKCIRGVGMRPYSDIDQREQGGGATTTAGMSEQPDALRNNLTPVSKDANGPYKRRPAEPVPLKNESEPIYSKIQKNSLPPFAPTSLTEPSTNSFEENYSSLGKNASSSSASEKQQASKQKSADHPRELNSFDQNEPPQPKNWSSGAESDRITETNIRTKTPSSGVTQSANATSNLETTPLMEEGITSKNLKLRIARASIGIACSTLTFIGGLVLGIIAPPAGLTIMLASGIVFVFSLYKLLSNNSKFNEIIINDALNKEILPNLNKVVDKIISKKKGNDPIGYEFLKGLTLQERNSVIKILRNGLNRQELVNNPTPKNKIKNILGFHIVEITKRYDPENSNAGNKKAQKVDEAAAFLTNVVDQKLGNPATESRSIGEKLAKHLTVNEIKKLTEILDKGRKTVQHKGEKYGNSHINFTPLAATINQA